MALLNRRIAISVLCFVESRDTASPLRSLEVGLTCPCIQAAISEISIFFTAGSDVGGIETVAERSADGRHWVINGTKKWITQGQKADYCLTAVRTGAPGAKGISMFMVPMNAKGVTKRKLLNSGVSSSG